MKKKLFALAALVAALGSAGTASAQDVLTGDTRLACEAILCLRRARARANARRRFAVFQHHGASCRTRSRSAPELPRAVPGRTRRRKCPSLVSAISRGAGRCDAQSLNQTLVMWTGGDDGETYISNQMPDYCAAYTGHAYTDFASSGTLPRYVGTPERGGYWVEAKRL
jgi:hypothetical protein